MPAFLKNPKFIIGTIIVIWIVYVIAGNWQMTPIDIHLLPAIATLQVKVSAIIIGALIAGSIITLAVQFFWRRWRRRRSSKNVSPAKAAS